MKKTLALATLALLASVFAGCSGGTGTSMIPTAPQQAQAHQGDALGGQPAHR